MSSKRYLFQYNLPSDNHAHGATDHYIDVKSIMIGSMVYTEPYVSKIDLRVVKDWGKVLDDIDKIGQEHFDKIINDEKIKAAKELLQKNDNPILERLAVSEIY